MDAEKVLNILSRHLPQSALDYCLALWKNSPFELKITKTRQSKVGDFTSRRNIRYPRITLNHDLNPYLFLVTYIHEVAHLHVFLKHGNRTEPHGDEWKNAYQELMIPILEKDVFPDEILHVLRLHMVNPKASSFADADLTRAFRLFDKNASQFACLSDLPEGSVFSVPGKVFQEREVEENPRALPGSQHQKKLPDTRRGACEQCTTEPVIVSLISAQ